jgi:outer membrane protein assembly factor BamD
MRNGLSALCLVALCACAPEPKTALGYTADAKRAYDTALAECTAKNWLDCQTKMREVRRKYSYSRYGKLAELRIADAEFEQDKFVEAIRAYRQFIHDHRSDANDVAYARSRIAEAEYRQIPDSFLLPAGEERDQASVMEAYKELRGYLHDYPDAQESVRVRQLLDDVTARLVSHELYVARFYLAKDNYDATIGRIEYALRNFSGASEATSSSLEPDLLLLLGETYLRMHQWKYARGAFEGLLLKFPRNALTTGARNYLAYMRERGV